MIPVEAPAFTPLPGGLLDVVPTVSDVRSMYGLSVDPIICGPLHHMSEDDFCGTGGQSAEKDLTDGFSDPILLDPFMVYRAVTCYLNGGDYESMVTDWFSKRVTYGVESAIQDQINPIADLLDTDVLTPRQGLALLEDWLGTMGAGMIMGSRGSVTRLGGDVRNLNGGLATRLETPIVAAGGFDNDGPGATASAGVLYATGPMWVFRSGSVVSNVQTHERNTRTVLVEETFTAYINCGVAAVLIGD